MTLGGSAWAAVDTATTGSPPLLIHPRHSLVSGAPVGAGESQGGLAVGRILALPPVQPVDFEVLTYQPEELALRVWCSRDGWLWVTDRWAPGWTATVNGVQIPVWGGNFIFRALPVRAGENVVRFTYHPFGFPWLVIVSWGTLTAVLVWSWWGRRVGTLPSRHGLGGRGPRGYEAA